MIILTYAAVGLNNILKKYRVSPSSSLILKEKSEGFHTKVRYNAFRNNLLEMKTLALLLRSKLLLELALFP